MKFLQERGSIVPLLNKICFNGSFIYISESRTSSINHSKDIASTNKVVKSVNSCFEGKYANIWTRLSC